MENMLLFSASLAPAPDDSLAMAIGETIKTVSSMSSSEIWQLLLDTFTKWGLKILAALLIYFIGAWLIRKIRRMLKALLTKRKVEASLSTFLVSLTNISLTVLLFVVVVTIMGVPASTFAALLAAGGLAIGMALSGTLQNFAGGVMILLFKPFKVGDYIETSGYSGTVDAINITTTQIHTVDNKIVFLPNGTVANSNIQNYSATELRRVDWNITISYGDDAGKAIDLIKTYLKEDSRVLDTPAPPFAAISELGSSAVVITARAWTTNDAYWDLFYDMNRKIYEKLPAEGLHFPYPQLDVFIKNR